MKNTNEKLFEYIQSQNISGNSEAENIYDSLLTALTKIDLLYEYYRWLGAEEIASVLEKMNKENSIITVLGDYQYMYQPKTQKLLCSDRYSKNPSWTVLGDGFRLW